MTDGAQREVVLTLPMFPNIELVAAQTAATLADLMSFDQNRIDEIQLATIETIINAFEYCKSKDKQVFIKFMMKDDALELSVTDHGVGFRPSFDISDINGEEKLRKRGWGLPIIREMMDEVHVESNDKGTTVTITKKKRL